MLDAGNSTTTIDKRFSSASLVKLCLITNNISNTITEPKVTFALSHKGSWFFKDLLTENGNFLTFQEFSVKYSRQTNFLQYYQVVSTIPKHLLSIAKQTDDFNKSFFNSHDTFPLSETVQKNLGKVKTRDFYKLLNVKTHNEDHTGPLRWSRNL